MAFTKAPVFNDYQVRRVTAAGSPFVRGSNEINPISLKYIDCHPIDQPNWNSEKRDVVIKREAFATGNTFTLTVGTNIFWNQIISESPDPGTGIINTFFQLGGTFYHLPAPFTTPSTVFTGLSTGGSGTLAVNSSNINRAVFINNVGGVTNIHGCNEFGAGGPTTTALSIVLASTRGLVFLNGYLFAIDSSRNRIYNSAPGGNLNTWTTTNFIAAEMFPDSLNFIAKHKNHLVVFGESSIEFFYDAAQPIGSPLARQEAYASRIGSYFMNTAQQSYAQIGDDIYFIGKAYNQSLGLYRIRDFRVEEIPCQYFTNILNYGRSTTVPIDTISTIHINGKSMILLSCRNFDNSAKLNIVYFPENNSWWEITDPDNRLRYFNMLGPMFINPNDQKPTWFWKEGSSSTAGVVFMDTERYLYQSASVYSDIIDFETNFNKCINRIDALGDFGNNTLRLAICVTPNYNQFFDLGPVTPLTSGLNRVASWFKMGRINRFSLRLDIEGEDPAVFHGWDVIYNLGYK